MPSIKEQLTCTTIPDMSGIVVEAYCTRIPSVEGILVTSTTGCEATGRRGGEAQTDRYSNK